MKKTLIKIISLIIVLAICVTSFSFVVPVYAEDKPLMLYVETDAPSEYGYQNYRYVNENGEEYVFENNEVLFTQAVQNLPSSYDSRDYGYVSEIKYQGPGGNCWSYSIMSMLETNSIMKGYKTAASADFSEAHLTWFTGRGLAQDTNNPAYGDGYDIERPFYYGGNWRRGVATLARWSGVADESEFPSDPYNLDSLGDYAESDRYNTSSGVLIESAQRLTTAEDLKLWIKENGSASAMFYYDDLNFNSSTAAYYCPDATPINHMITIIGWDDDYPASNFKNAPPANGAWICKNSWSTRWGDKGYFMISYYDTSIKEFAGVTARTTESCYKNYTYNGTEWNNAIGMYGAVQAGNVFVSDGYESLDSIGIQTVNSGIKTKISIYKNLPDGYKNPVSGTLVATKELVFDREGFHTIYFDNTITFEPGEKFSVVAEYESTISNATFVAVENGAQEFQHYSSREGESFINLYPSYSSRWQPVSERNVHNVYIQAFTKCEHQIETKTEGLTCTEDGTEYVYCTQCGKIESEKAVYHSGHIFGNWSQFAKNLNGEEVSTRVCEKCDLTETRKLVFMNVITLSDVFEFIFSHIIRFIRQLKI